MPYRTWELQRVALIFSLMAEISLTQAWRSLWDMSNRDSRSQWKW